MMTLSLKASWSLSCFSACLIFDLQKW